MNNIIKGLIDLRPVTLSGVAKTSMLSQHNLMPENGGKAIKKMIYSIDKNSGSLVLTSAGGSLIIDDYVNYNGDGSGDKKYIFDSIVVKTPGDILADYRKDEKGALQPYALQLDLIYHLDKNSHTFLIVKVPICVTSGAGNGKLKYQQFFQELVGKIGGGSEGTVDLETKDFTLTDLYPLHGEIDKEEMTFFTYDYPNMRKEGVGDIENLHVIVFKNHLVLNCDNVANKLVKAVLGFGMGTCDANMDEDHQMCMQVDMSSKFSALMKNVAERVGTNSKDVDIFAVSLRLSPEDYNKMTEIDKKNSRRVNGDGDGDDDGDGDGDGDGDSDGDGEKEEFQATAEHPYTVTYNIWTSYPLIVGISIIFLAISIFYFSYYKPFKNADLSLLENIGKVWEIMGSDISGFVQRVLGMGIGPGISVMGLQVLQPKIDRSLGETIKRAVGLRGNRSTAVGALERTGEEDIFNSEIGNVTVRHINVSNGAPVSASNGAPVGAPDGASNGVPVDAPVGAPDEVRRVIPKGTVIQGTRKDIKGIKKSSIQKMQILRNLFKS
jgi:hypothetical protein